MNKNTNSFGITLIRGLLLLVIATMAVGVVSRGQHASAQNVAQSYIAESSLQPGMIIQQGNDSKRVKPVTQSSASKMLGVIVQPNDTPLSLNEENAGANVYVASSGTYHVLVSSQNGPIKQGDFIVISSLEGIGMKANDSATFIVGKALDNYDGKTGVLSSTTVKDSKGGDHTVSFGYITTNINIGRNPLFKTATVASSSVPSFLQKISDSIADRPVTPVRIYASVAVLFIVTIIVCVVMYTAIRTSVTSLGRNPLARKSIFKNMVAVVLVAVIILISGLFAVYLLLKL